MRNRLIIIGLFLILISFSLILYSNSSISKIKPSHPPVSTSSTNPKVVSTNPPNLTGDTIISPTQDISITFNLPIVNAEQFKSRMDPPTPFTVILSDDRKTATIHFTNPLGFDHGFTLFIDQMTQFDGHKFLKQGLNFSFHTISYSGV